MSISIFLVALIIVAVPFGAGYLVGVNTERRRWRR